MESGKGSLLEKVITEELSLETFERRHNEMGEGTMWRSRGRVFQAKGIASAKA